MRKLHPAYYTISNDPAYLNRFMEVVQDKCFSFREVDGKMRIHNWDSILAGMILRHAIEFKEEARNANITQWSHSN